MSSVSQGLASSELLWPSRMGASGVHSSVAGPCPSFYCRIFTKVVLEAPLITESALEVIRKYCEDEVRRTTPGDRPLSLASWRRQEPSSPQPVAGGQAPVLWGASDGHIA